MSTIELDHCNAASALLVEPPEAANRIGQLAMIADVGALADKMLAKSRLSILIGAALFTSGIFHLTLLWFTGADWSGPLSLRKPGLFGISGGVTVWSIIWVLTQLEPRQDDQRLGMWLSGSLLLEVGLITLQHWRGALSHFNRTTALDATIVTIMLGLILLVTAGIARLCWRSRRLKQMLESDAMALRAGLWFLLLSCGLGLLVTISGEINLAQGRSPEVWGRAGVLKYPHGAALHAIQVLPLLSAVLNKLKIPYKSRLVQAAVASNALFLAHAVWQTFNGRTRMDLDVIGGATITMSGLLILVPLVSIVCRCHAIALKLWIGPNSCQKPLLNWNNACRPDVFPSTVPPASSD